MLPADFHHPDTPACTPEGCLRPFDFAATDSVTMAGGRVATLRLRVGVSKVYISSTFRDLKRCRLRVAEAVRMLGHQDVAMEHYAADPRPPLHKCLEDVADSDVYVGLFGRRYGWVPPGTQRSITEQEYRQAVRARKEILVFLLDEKAHQWKEASDERPQRRALLDALRHELSARHLAGRFGTCSELEVKVMAALADLGRAPVTPADIEREDKLLQLAASKDAATRERAARALVEMGSAAYAATLRAHLRRGRASMARRQADVGALARIESRNHRVMPMLRDLFDAPAASTRAAVVWEFAQQALAGRPVTDADVRAILELWTDASEDVRREVAHASWKFLPYCSDATKRIMGERLRHLVRDPDSDVRATAAYSASRLQRGY